MAQDRRKRTYRVRQIPDHVEEGQLIRILITAAKDLGPGDNILVHSLSQSLSHWERPRTKVATVVFRDTPTRFDNDDPQWIIPTKHLGMRADIVIDVHFLNFTPLNDVMSATDSLDCIAISGLASHPFGSWMHRGAEPGFMWLRDKLPKDITGIRSIIYGYDTSLLTSQSFQTIEDIARSFITRLRTIGYANLPHRSVVFLAHSLGGIILKRALLDLANSGDAHARILDMVRAVILIGVPNRGMKTSHLLSMTADQPNATLIETLSPESTYLQELDDLFTGIASTHNLRIVSVYETSRSRTTMKNDRGEWERNGPYEVLVSTESAIHRASKLEEIFPINQDHSNMIKFNEDDADYQVIAAIVFAICTSLLLCCGASKTLNHARASQKVLPQNALLDVDNQRPSDLEYNDRNLEEDAARTIGSPETNELERRLKILQTAIPTVQKQNLESEEQRQMRIKTFQDDLLTSLLVAEAQYRPQNINAPHEGTYEWIWSDSKLGFRKWLNSEDNVYWITGKPGSGKSTLMKHIYSHENTKAVMNRQGTQTKLISACFFFHGRGSKNQKSFKAVLQSILHQVLSAERTIICDIFKDFLRDLWISKKEWSLEQMESSFSRLLEQHTAPLSVYLFLDALDEYDGPPEFVANFVKSLVSGPKSSETRFKVCFSSRPWNIFVDEFSSYPGFAIHEHTQRDISKYIEGRFHENPSFCSILSSPSITEHGNFSALKSAIGKKAEGVFVWLKLALDALISARTNGSSVEELFEDLSKLPDELDTYYKMIVEGIPGQFRWESYVMLEIILRTDAAIPWRTFLAVFTCALQESVERANCKILALTSNASQFDQFRRRVSSRCGGLINFVSSIHNGHEVTESATPLAQFMHQSVKDFVAKPGLKQLIMHNHKDFSFENGHSFLAKYGVAMLTQGLSAGSTMPKSLWWHGNRNEALRWMKHTTQAELSTGNSQKSVFDQVDDHAFNGISDDFNSFMSFAVVHDLRLLVHELPRGYVGAVLVNSNPEMPLLHYVLGSSPNRRILYPQYRPDYRYKSEMVQLLLSLGADVNAIAHGYTPFHYLFLAHCSGRSQFETSNDAFLTSSEKSLLNSIEALLESGQPLTTMASGTINKIAPLAMLHQSGARLTKLLVKYGFDVNTLNSDGWTPLDQAVRSLHNADWYDTEEHVEAICNNMVALLSHGGCFTKNATEYLPECLGNRRPGHILHVMLKNPPFLETRDGNLC